MRPIVSDIPKLRINSERLKADFDALAEIGATRAGGVSRQALSTEDIEARMWFADRIDDAGLCLRDDDVGNLSGVLLSEDSDAKTLLLGSHLDTVPNGGHYDGVIGVLAALECLRTVKEAGLKLPVHLEAIDFTDEEGCWQSLFGSLGLAGMLNSTHINDVEENHAPFRAALFRAGINPYAVSKAKRDSDTLAGFLELHIEQGRRLDDAGLDVGLVTEIVGRTTSLFTFYGETGHSATTEIDKRKDALQGVAHFILRAYGLIRDQYPMGMLNCADVKVQPGVYNMIPDKATLTVECRHPGEEALAEMVGALIRLSRECAVEYTLTVNSQRIAHMPAATMSPLIVQRVESVCKRLGVSNQSLISYAGHDAQIISNLTPTGMIFIPSVKGVSHNPKEYCEWENVVKGADVLLHTMLELATGDAK